MQRKQLHKTVQGTESKSTKPSTSPSPPKEGKKQQNKNEEKQTFEEKLEELSLDDTQETIPTSQSPEPSSQSISINENPTDTKDRERIQSDSQDTSSFKDVEQPTTTAGEEVEQETAGGGEEEEEGESEDQEELKAKVEATEEQLLKRLEQMQTESQETQETIKRMTGYLKALDVAPNEISRTDEGASPQPESQGAGDDDGVTGGSASVMVGDIDPIAQAALLASINERTTSASSQEEAGEIMEPVQVSETDPSNIVIVGEIVGPQIAPPKSILEEDTHSTASESIAVDPKLECGESGGLIRQTAQEPIDEKVGDTPAVPKTEPSQQDSVMEVAKEIIEAPVPSFQSPSKKPKRQLAASFTNITKE